METKRIQIKDYNYNLPDERIAKYPLKNRDMSKLLVYRQGNITQDKFCNLSTYLPKGALMIFNNTKVIQARMFFRKERSFSMFIPHRKTGRREKTGQRGNAERGKFPLSVILGRYTVKPCRCSGCWPRTAHVR